MDVYLRDKEKRAEKNRLYYEKNKEHLINKSSLWYENNKDKKKEYDAKRYIEKKNIISKKAKERYEKNKDRIIEKNSKYIVKRYKNDEQYKIKMNLRHRLREAFKRYSKNGKVKKSKDYGIDWNEIIEYLQPFPENIEKYDIDHIIPLCAFDFNDPNQIKAAFAPENHRWLLREENQRKNGSYKKEDYINYMKNFKNKRRTRRCQNTK